MVDISKYINEIKNETLQLFFYLSEYELNQKELPKGKYFINKYSNELKKLFPKCYSLFEEKINEENIIIKRLLTDTILLENGYYDPKDLNTINNIPYDKFFSSYSSYYADWRFYAKGIESNDLGFDDIIKYIEDNPIHFRFLLPILVNKGSIKEYEYLNKRIQDAKLEDNIRVFIFESVLRSNNVDCVKYFINQIRENNYFRFKALKQLNSITGDYNTNLDIKKCLNIFEDAYNYDYQKYLSLDFQHNYYFLKRLKQFNKENYKEYLKLAVMSDNIKARRAAFYATNYRGSNEFHYFEYLLKYINEIELELEDFSFFPIFIDYNQIDKALADELFKKFLSYYDSMTKVNYHYKMDTDITTARDISKKKMIMDCLSLAIRSGNKDNFKQLDERAAAMNDETLAFYLENAKEYTKLNIRKEALALLKTDNYAAQRLYNSLNINLTYDEAVLVSDYLKSKKESVKKQILDAYLKSNSKNKIADYLTSSNVDYKASIGLEMQEKLGIKKDITLVKPTDKINEILKENIELVKLKSIDYKVACSFFDKLKAFINKHKDYEYTRPYINDVVTFGSEFTSINVKNVPTIRDYPLGELLALEFKDAFSEEEYVYLAYDLYFFKYSENEYIKIFGKDNKKISYYKSISATYEYKVANILIPLLIKEYVKDEVFLKIYISIIYRNRDIEFKDSYYGDISILEIVRLCKSIDCLYLWRYIIALYLSMDKAPAMSWFVIIMLIENKIIDEEIIKYMIVKYSDFNSITNKIKNPLYLNKNDFKYL